MHPVRIRIGPVHLVDRNDDRNTGCLCMIDGFHRLRHDAVIGSYHEHDDIRSIRTARPHGRERFMAGGIEERDLVTARHPHLVGTDMLRDATGLTGDDVRRPKRVQQRRLAVIDMTHDRHHRRARLKVRVVLVFASP